MDAHTHILQYLRWIHFMAGITWIGLLYFFNVVNGHFQAALDADTRTKVVPELMPRALWWFRWGAMVTLISGLLYIFWSKWITTWGQPGMGGFFGSQGLWSSSWGGWITLGSSFGIIMWFNVWFIIWPAQKKIITWTKAGQSPPERAKLASRATKTSRVNTYLSVPLLFAMGGASHFATFGWLSAILVVLVGFIIVWVFVSVAKNVGTKV
ncbi:MAG: urate hydroxylase PuuD [Candidatus Tectomicrobia bacterium]|nr:urate hydroxylase PuuD [Candidatus Tectomicrobia bacterium]